MYQRNDLKLLDIEEKNGVSKRLCRESRRAVGLSRLGREKEGWF
jgi:hypothetical protein